MGTTQTKGFFAQNTTPCQALFKNNFIVVNVSKKKNKAHFLL